MFYNLMKTSFYYSTSFLETKILNYNKAQAEAHNIKLKLERICLI